MQILFPRLIAVLAMLFGSAPTHAAQTLLIHNCTLIDVDKGTAHAEPHSILISNGRIQRISPTEHAATMSADSTIDATGLFIIPGLWDSHAHVNKLSSQAKTILLRHGITSLRDMGGDAPTLAPMIQQFNEHAQSGRAPSVYSARTIIESEAWLAGVKRALQSQGNPEALAEISQRIGIGDPSSARAAVNRLANEGAHFIKIRNFASPESFAALCEAAREHNLPVAGHAPLALSTPEAIRSGLACVEHSIMNAFVFPESHRNELAQQTRNALIESGSAWCPTLVMIEQFDASIPECLDQLDQIHEAYPNPNDLGISTQTLELWRWMIPATQPRAPDTPKQSDTLINLLRDILQSTDDAPTIPVLAGTDFGAPLIFPGESLHTELRLMETSLGLDPARILRAATCNPADWLGIDDQVGRIREDLAADLILLRENPLDSADAYASIVCVIKSGIVAHHTHTIEINDTSAQPEPAPASRQ